MKYSQIDKLTPLIVCPDYKEPEAGILILFEEGFYFYTCWLRDLFDPDELLLSEWKIEDGKFLFKHLDPIHGYRRGEWSEDIINDDTWLIRTIIDRALTKSFEQHVLGKK